MSVVVHWLLESSLWLFNGDKRLAVVVIK